MPNPRSLFAMAALALTAIANPQSVSAQKSTQLAATGVTPGMASMTTSSAEAKSAFSEGLRALDVERRPAARAAFLKTTAADPSFALGHLYAAFAANSLPEYRAHLGEAVKLATTASEPERLMIQNASLGYDNNLDGQLQLGEQLVKAAPSDPRAWLTLAGNQSNLGREAAARQSMAKAIALAPNFASAHVLLGNSYLQVEPRDLAQAEKHIREAVTLEPAEPFTHDYLGDVYRGQNKLAQARAEYSRMIELNPKLAGAYQQRGHTNSFLGNYAQARADYDRAIALGEANERSTYSVPKALVSVHAGDPAAAEHDLDQLAAAIDGMKVPDPTSEKISALENETLIALHSGHLEVAQRTIDKLRALYMKQADEGGTPVFRRGVEASISYDEGMLEARKGNYATANGKAAQYMQLRASENNPRKDEPAHALMGMTALIRHDYTGAVSHFDHTDPNDIYFAYHHALALEGAGKTAEARVLFKRVAETNFNSAGLALVKKDAMRRVK